MVLELFLSSFEIGQQIVGQYFIRFLNGYIFQTNKLLGMVFIWFLIHSVHLFLIGSSTLLDGIKICKKYNLKICDCKSDDVNIWGSGITYL